MTNPTASKRLSQYGSLKIFAFIEHFASKSSLPESRSWFVNLHEIMNLLPSVTSVWKWNYLKQILQKTDWILREKRIFLSIIIHMPNRPIREENNRFHCL